MNYNKFEELLKKKEIKNINFKNKKIQKYYVEYENIENPTLKNNFYSLTKIKLELSLSTISIIRNNINDKYFNLIYRINIKNN
jgi:hypothetical protein